jgi:hypothetical protein
MIWAVSLSTTKLISRSPTALLWSFGIPSLIGFSKRKGPSPIQCCTSKTKRMTLALKLFRGEPAISEFVWHITSTHRSSPNFATLVSSGLHEWLDSLHPAHG